MSGQNSVTQDPSDSLEKQRSISDASNIHTYDEARVRTIVRAEKLHILVLNAKGGSGKTTVATNLASYYTTTKNKPALIDFDSQGSSSHWLAIRAKEKNDIYGIKAYKKNAFNETRSKQLSVPHDVSRLIYDTPGNMDGLDLDKLIEKSDIIIIPVQPSPIDIHAATRFIHQVLLNHYFRKSKKRLAVVANRAKANTIVYSKLRLFLNRLGIPFITTIRDSQNYVKAFESGLGISELTKVDKKADIENWRALLEWIEEDPKVKAEEQSQSPGYE